MNNLVKAFFKKKKSYITISLVCVNNEACLHHKSHSQAF
jgi:hypothetical protein